MRKQESDTLGKFALVFTVLGVGGYLVLSSGIFGKLTAPPVAKESSSTNSQQMVQEWRRQLEAIDQQSSEKQNELEDLTYRLAQLRLEVQQSKTEMSRNLSRNRASGRSRAADAAVKNNFSSFDDLKGFLFAAGGKFDFSVESGPDGITYQSVTLHRPFAENSLYLRRLGLRWARAVSKAALDLQVQSLIIRYVSGGDPARKAQVMKGFLEDQLQANHIAGVSRDVQVELQEVDEEEVVSESKLDLVMAFDQSSKRGER